MVSVAITANAFYFLLVVLELGNLELVGITVWSSLQIVLGLSLGLAAIKLITVYLSLPPKSLAKDKR